MSRWLCRAVLAASLGAALAACSDGNYYGYGYAVNERPSLAQLGIASADPDNSFGPAAAATPLKDASAAP